MFDVLGIGCNAIDYLCLLDGYPSEDEKTEIDVIEMQGGGNIGTALVAVSRLGGKAAYHGFIGNDEFRDIIFEEFNNRGINTEYLHTKDGRNPIAFILINRLKSTRTIVYSKMNIPPFPPEEVNTDIITLARVLLVDFYYEEASLMASQAARRKGIPVVIDAERFCPMSRDILANGTHIIASRSFAQHLTEYKDSKNIEDILGKFAQMVNSPFICITLGKEGAISLDREKGKMFWQKAYRVDTVDTTGAGDVFHGAFAYFLSQGFPIEKAVRYSTACSAIKCKQLGGRKGIPTMDELLEFLKEKSY